MPTFTTIPVTQIENMNINELTTGSIDGEGTFDLLMKTLKAHLWNEYENERIRGTDYANAYIQAMNGALGHIMDYALKKATLPLELEQLEANVQKTAAETVYITKQGGLIDAQIYSTMKEVELKDYELKYIKPIELELKKEELAIRRLEAELKKLDIELKKQEFELRKVEIELRKEELKLKKQEFELRKIEIALKEKQLALAEKELAIKDKELTLKETQIAMAKYELDFKLPAEVESTKAQGDLYKQKVITEKAQTDPSVIGEGSVISHNNKVLAQQARSYDNDTKLKLTSMLIDTWKVRHNDDPDATPVDHINNLHDPIIGKMVIAVKESAGITD